MDRRKEEGQACGGVVSSADVSTPGLGLLVSRGREVGRGGQPLGVLVPGAPRRMDDSQSSHTEISYVVPPTPDTFLTSVCRAGQSPGLAR